MTRTIHDTLGVADRAMAADWADEEIPKTIAREMERNWKRQQGIRASERRLRRRDGRAPQPVDPETVPIIVEPGPKGVFHAIDVEDVREVLCRLPPGSLDGLQSIRLCSHRGDDDAWNEVVPGWYWPSPLGSYYPPNATISLFGYRCDGDELGPLSLFIMVEQLKTLLHETAHHFDDTFRKGRHRWIDDEAKDERWAERMERQQAVEIIWPLVEKRYPSRCAEASRWLEEHAGAAIDPLAIMCQVETAFMILVHAALTDVDRDVARVSCARFLHRKGVNQDARAITDAVLAGCPDHAGALAVSACIHQCDARDFQAAEDLGRRAVTADPTDMNAWDVLVRGYAMQRKWEQAALACESAISHVPAGRKPRWYFVSTLAEAHLNLRDRSGIEADVARMRALDNEDASLEADIHELLAFSWSEEWEQAFSLASRLLAAGKHGGWKNWLIAARFESAHRLGRPEQAGRLAEANLRRLERAAYTAEWGRRIRGLVEAAAPR